MKDQIPLGITDDQVALGSHLVHFWQNEEEFERGVRFLEPGIANESQYCVLYRTRRSEPTGFRSLAEDGR